MKHLKIITKLLVCILICSNSYAQNKKPILSKKQKAEKKQVVKNQVSDSVSIIVPAEFPTIDKKKYPKVKLKAQKKMFVSTNQTESNCSGAFFRYSGLFVKYNKKDKEWTLLCEAIVGFNYQKGKEYKIVVNIYDIDYGSAGCADDCPRVKYELVKIVSQK
jgi:hypothetical protein